MRNLWENHPKLLSWAALALGMVIIVIFAARNVGFQAGQWAAILVATVLLAGLCVWIVGWEDAAETGSPDAAAAGDQPAVGAGPEAGQDAGQTGAATAHAATAARDGDL